MNSGGKIGAALLLVLGLAQMAGGLLGLPALRGLAAATGASPAPKVFSAAGGLETYSTRFFLEWRDTGGATRSLELTPEIYARLRGPYSRRNVYGAVLAYGPVLASDPRTRPLFESVARHALCGDRPLLAELGIGGVARGAAGEVRIRLEPRPDSFLAPHLPLVLEAPCR